MKRDYYFLFGIEGGMKRLWFCLMILTLFSIKNVQSAGTTSTAWIVYDSDHSPCIRMEAIISLNLTYLVGYPDVHVRHKKFFEDNKVPTGLIVNNDLSSCSKSIIFNNVSSIASQVLHLDFPHDPSWAGWSIEFYFSQDSIFHASTSEFTLYGVQVIANYTSQPTLFKNSHETNHTYTQAIMFGTTSPSEIADNIYANKHYSYFCSSSQEYPINRNNEEYGLEAWITLKNIRVQAYAPPGNTKFGDREICPQDQTSDDLIPIIVGGVLATLVVITLIIYLVYRARQPPSVLYLTNPHSHFEDFGSSFKPGHNESGEDDEESINIESQRRVDRHLQEHSNYGFEE